MNRPFDAENFLLTLRARLSKAVKEGKLQPEETHYLYWRLYPLGYKEKDLTEKETKEVREAIMKLINIFMPE